MLPTQTTAGGDPVCVHYILDYFRLFLPLLCKDGDFFRRGKSREVEAMTRAATFMLHTRLALPHPALPLQRGGKDMGVPHGLTTLSKNS